MVVIRSISEVEQGFNKVTLELTIIQSREIR